ncbi:ATP-independent RNA helicase DbpA [Pseudoalteromonas ulvae UL12]|uniref:DEAD-box ATP-dependent RNA helicase RhpA n=1 Tax=Pseudoalteromonas ulvae TaxID=107327 RepID=A0A2C9ZZH3_PSEDV|nr:ATP-dependent RNA helicase DbpA [Pseudoalteromonas ulvae]MBE0364685.1 ATP-independent RNA helicase DbpA [Pseudoalteromonas ulvae UL12]OUL56171.1 ATP-dependent RNA helicase DbpA [Pseudoalteromonas ulvae]
MSQSAFSSLKLQPALLENLTSLEYTSMTPIQAQSLPHILEGKDVIAQAKTGSGKTATFALGLLENLDVRNYRIQALVLCPTRELADQVAQEIRTLARGIPNVKVLTLCGGVPMGPQIGSLEHGAHIIVGTPGRIEDHLSRRTLNLHNVNTLVLDEADRMLDMGFASALDAVIDQTPHDRQTLFFSATFPEKIQSIANRTMRNPIKVTVETSHNNVNIRQYFYKLEQNKQRMTALRLLLLKHRPESCVVFCNTKVETQAVADELSVCSFSVLALHGDLEQRERDQTLVRFANKSVSILVATDVAARGLDINELDMVINYHITQDPEVHVHRIGRTGRAGSKGTAHSLFTDNESYRVAAVSEYFDKQFDITPLPPFSLLDKIAEKPPMITLQIDGGKKQKVRPGDILGALTSKDGISGKQVGKINVLDNFAYVAVARDAAKPALRKLGEDKIKGRLFRVRRIS